MQHGKMKGTISQTGTRETHAGMRENQAAKWLDTNGCSVTMGAKINGIAPADLDTAEKSLTP
jgi:hypothetical protein